jgi:hypothetical protein
MMTTDRQLSIPEGTKEGAWATVILAAAPILPLPLNIAAEERLPVA